MSNAHNLPFTTEEYELRLQRVRQAMRERQIDVLLVDQTEFLAYLTGYSISENMYRACLVPLDGEVVLALRAVDLGPFAETSWLDASQAVAFADWEDPVHVIAETVKARGWASKRIGIDEDSYNMPLRRFKKLKTALPDATFVDFSGVLEVLRSRKSLKEIEYLRRASQIADETIGDIVETSGEGTSARDVAATAHTSFIARGADTGRPGLFNLAEGDNFLHGVMTGKPLCKGDVLHMELLPMVCGYSARLMRPAVVGRDDARSAVAQQLVDIQDHQFAQMKPGAYARDIDATVRSPILEAGLRQKYLNITGYTLGHYPTSTPRTSDFTRIFLPNSDWVLEEGMVFHMYVSAAGVAFSETVLVTKTGVDLLTKSPRKLLTL